MSAASEQGRARPESTPAGDGLPAWLRLATTAIEAVATRRQARKPRITPGDVLDAEAVPLDAEATEPSNAWNLGWWLPTADATTSVVLVHGFGATAADLAPIARHLMERGHAVMLTEQRQLPRPPRSEAEYRRTAPWAAITAAIDWLRPRTEASNGVAIVGHSMGGSSSLAAAAFAPDAVRGVVTLGAIADPTRTRMAAIPAVLNRRAAALMSRQLGRDLSAEIGIGAMQRLDCEVVVTHGTRDRVIPVRNASLLAAANPRAKLILVPDRGHAPAPLYAEIRDVVDEHLTRWFATEGPGTTG